jgi:hypothetical protein
LVTYAIQLPKELKYSTLAVVLLTAVAALASGVMLGFLFGIPRALQQLPPTPVGSENRSGGYAVNTNLEQISDWLTKILVGIGLVQLGAIVDSFGDLVAVAAASLGGRQESSHIAATEMVFFFVWGFLLGYLLTRTYLTAAFRAFDLEEVKTEVAYRAASIAYEKTQQREREQDAVDAQALALAAQLLSPGSDSLSSERARDVTRFEEVLVSASPPVREHVYLLAQTQRRLNWSWRHAGEPSDNMRRMHDRTVEILRALTALDPGDHRFQGDLGFALIDKADPEYERAIDHLDIAVNAARLDPESGKGEAWYRLARVRARTNLLGDAAPSTELRETVRADVDRILEMNGRPGRIVIDEGLAARWLD